MSLLDNYLKKKVFELLYSSEYYSRCKLLDNNNIEFNIDLIGSNDFLESLGINHINVIIKDGVLVLFDVYIDIKHLFKIQTMSDISLDDIKELEIKLDYNLGMEPVYYLETANYDATGFKGLINIPVSIHVLIDISNYKEYIYIKTYKERILSFSEFNNLKKSNLTLYDVNIIHLTVDNFNEFEELIKDLNSEYGKLIHSQKIYIGNLSTVCLSRPDSVYYTMESILNRIKSNNIEIYYKQLYWGDIDKILLSKRYNDNLKELKDNNIYFNISSSNI